MEQNHFRRGFETQLEEVSVDDVAVDGKIPDWLQGTIVRNGPGQFELEGVCPDDCYKYQDKRVCYVHWFDGLAMPHRFTIKDGRVSFANRYMITQTYTQDNKTGKVNSRMSATNPKLTWWQKLISPFYIKFMDNTNVHTLLSDGEYIALTERTKGFAFDPQTLATKQPFVYKNLKSTAIQTAHPHYDPKTNISYNYMLDLGPFPTYNLYRVVGREATRIAQIRTSNPSYMHSFGMTEHYFILAEYPVRLSIWAQFQFLFTEIPIFGNFAWNPQVPTYFTVIDRETGAIVAKREAEPFFCFHHVNAFERDGEVVVDVAAYADSTIIQGLYLQTMRSQDEFSTMTAEFRRYRIPIRSDNDAVTWEHVLRDKGLILPRINYNDYNTKPYRWTYGVSHFKETRDFVNQIVKIDVEVGAVDKYWHVPGHYPSEPVFAPRPGATEEDDGVVLSTVYDSHIDKSYLIILDGKTFEPLAKAYTPIRLPFAFHGRWYSNGVMY